MRPSITLLLTAICVLSALNILHQTWSLLRRNNHLDVQSAESYFTRAILKIRSGQDKRVDSSCCISHLYDSIEDVNAFQLNVDNSCSKMLNWNRNETKQAISMRTTSLFTENLIEKAQNCSWLRNYLTNNFYNSELESTFPLAFTLVVHDNPEQILKLFRILYRWQNSFCIHCDAKSPHQSFFQSMAICLDNVVVPQNLTRVVWGHSSIVEAQVKCMNELVKLRIRQKYKWTYLLNLCGKELPLATNREMVLQLIKFNGTSNIYAHKISADQTEFYSRIMHPVTLDKNKTQIIFDKSKRLSDPPFNHSQYYYKSSGYHALSFPFVHHLLHNDTAISIRKFFFSCKNPEEHFYATVFMMPGVPGGYNSKIKHYFSIVNVFWVPPHQCAGKIVHRVCIIGAGDLAKVIAYGKGHFFHNKYFLENDHRVMHCLEGTLVAKNKNEYKFDCT